MSGPATAATTAAIDLSSLRLRHPTAAVAPAPPADPAMHSGCRTQSGPAATASLPGRAHFDGQQLQQRPVAGRQQQRPSASPRPARPSPGFRPAGFPADSAGRGQEEPSQPRRARPAAAERTPPRR